MYVEKKLGLFLLFFYISVFHAPLMQYLQDKKYFKLIIKKNTMYF